HGAGGAPDGARAEEANASHDLRRYAPGIADRPLSGEGIDRSDSEHRGAGGDEHMRAQPGWPLRRLALVANHGTQDKREQRPQHQLDIHWQPEVDPDHNSPRYQVCSLTSAARGA